MKKRVAVFVLFCFIGAVSVFSFISSKYFNTFSRMKKQKVETEKIRTQAVTFCTKDTTVHLCMNRSIIRVSSSVPGAGTKYIQGEDIINCPVSPKTSDNCKSANEMECENVDVCKSFNE